MTARSASASALVVVARESGEPMFLRFAELLAAKESPYGEFLRGQAREMRAEQNRYLERAADRAHLAMHLPLAPLIAVVVLWVSYRLPPLACPNDLTPRKENKMGTLTRIWLGLARGRVARDERGEVVTWVVLAIGIVVITTGVLAIVGPGVLNAGQKLVNEMK